MAMVSLQTLSSVLSLCLLLCLSCLPISLSITLSSFHYSKTTVRPYGWQHIRVDLPPGFSSMSFNLNSDVDIDVRTIKNLPTGKLPLICFRNGSPPLPDISNISLTVLSASVNNFIGGTPSGQLKEQCHPLQENIMLVLSNEQISLGVWYVGLFNGFGSASAQSKMIVRGSDFSFSANITVEGCPTSAMWGQSCNQTAVPFPCAQFDVVTSIENQTAEKVTTCRNSFGASCVGYDAPKGFSLDVAGIVKQLKIMANISLNGRPVNSMGNVSGFIYARYGAMPSGSVHDYSSNIGETPLVLHSPKVGPWFISLIPGNQTEGWVATEEKDITPSICYSLDWQIQECPVGKAGPNCTWESRMLQTVIRKSQSVPFESYYWPIAEKTSLDSSTFLLEPLLSNSSLGEKLDYEWTYFLLDIPHGAAGRHIHIQLHCDATLDYEIYSRFGGLPSLHVWDYYYSNKTSSSNGSVYFRLYDSSKRTVNFYILYAKEGTWSVGLRHPVRTANSNERKTFMSIASERCPQGCSFPHGTCQNVLDASGLTMYSYCACDRDHGGVDCGIQLVSLKGHIMHSIALIASNGAAILPAFWTLRQKAFTEWVLFTSSGISSGLYHACDVGTWCVLSFRVLQFMDFWLSFMAVVSTFVYLATIDEVSKRLMNTVVAILTALMAVNGATRSSNIIFVIAIGTLGLIIGWMIEFSTTIRSLSFPTMSRLSIIERLHSIKDKLYNFIKTLRSRFRWWYILGGFVALSLAGLSWKLETNNSYWIWHSAWHVSIYTSSFFFFCSKITTVDRITQEDPPTVAYELTRQDSLPRA